MLMHITTANYSQQMQAECKQKEINRMYKYYLTTTRGKELGIKALEFRLEEILPNVLN